MICWLSARLSQQPHCIMVDTSWPCPCLCIAPGTQGALWPSHAPGCRAVHAAIEALQASSAAGVQRMRELPLDSSEAAQQAALQALREGLAPRVQQASLHRCYRCAVQGGVLGACTQA